MVPVHREYLAGDRVVLSHREYLAGGRVVLSHREYLAGGGTWSSGVPSGGGWYLVIWST